VTEKKRLAYPEAGFLFHTREYAPTKAERCQRTILEPRACGEEERPAASEDEDRHQQKGVGDNRI